MKAIIKPQYVDHIPKVRGPIFLPPLPFVCPPQ